MLRVGYRLLVQALGRLCERCVARAFPGHGKQRATHLQAGEAIVDRHQRIDVESGARLDRRKLRAFHELDRPRHLIGRHERSRERHSDALQAARDRMRGVKRGGADHEGIIDRRADQEHALALIHDDPAGLAVHHKPRIDGHAEIVADPVVRVRIDGPDRKPLGEHRDDVGGKHDKPASLLHEAVHPVAEALIGFCGNPGHDQRADIVGNRLAIGSHRHELVIVARHLLKPLHPVRLVRAETGRHADLRAPLTGDLLDLARKQIFEAFLTLDHRQGFLAVEIFEHDGEIALLDLRLIVLDHLHAHLRNVHRRKRRRNVRIGSGIDDFEAHLPAAGVVVGLEHVADEALQPAVRLGKPLGDVGADHQRLVQLGQHRACGVGQGVDAVLGQVHAQARHACGGHEHDRRGDHDGQRAQRLPPEPGPEIRSVHRHVLRSSSNQVRAANAAVQASGTARSSSAITPRSMYS